MTEVSFKLLKYRGKHCRIRLLLFVLLDTLALGEGGWSQGKFYALPDLVQLAVPDLRYDYLRTRLSRLHRWRYLERKVLAPEKGRPLMGYRLGERGRDEIAKAPQSVYDEALAKVLRALPWLSPGPMNNQPKVEPGEPELPDDVWHPEETKPEPAESTFEPDSNTLYCLRAAQAGETHFLCGYPQRKCAFYEKVPEGAVVLHKLEDWNRTRQGPG